MRFPSLAKLLAPTLWARRPETLASYRENLRAQRLSQVKRTGALLFLNQAVNVLVETLETLSAFVRRAPVKNKSGQAAEARGDMFLALDDMAHSRCDGSRPRPTEEVILRLRANPRILGSSATDKVEFLDGKACTTPATSSQS